MGITVSNAVSESLNSYNTSTTVFSVSKQNDSSALIVSSKTTTTHDDSYSLNTTSTTPNAVTKINATDATLENGKVC